MKLPDVDELVKKIDWFETAKIVMPIVQPFVQGALWYGFTNFDKRAQALSRFIAIAEVIPAVDLNLPRGVVLASMYDGIEDALAIWAKLIDAIGEIPQAVKDLVEETVEKVEEIIPDPVEEAVEEAQEASHEFQGAIADCKANAQRELGWAAYPLLGAPWIVACMLQKGFKINLKDVKDKYF